MYNQEQAKIELFDIIYQIYEIYDEEMGCNEGAITDEEFSRFVIKVMSLYKEHYENKKC